MNPVHEVTVLLDVLIPGGRIADITLSDGVVRHIGASGQADRKIRCSDKYVLPAGVDMHVHMRDGPQSRKEDWKTGTMGALAGGVTVVVDQPNTIPTVTTPALLRERIRLASGQTYCHFGINAGVTPDADLEGMAQAGAMAFGETFAGPSSYGEELTREDLQKALCRIKKIEGLVTIHAEVVSQGEDTDLITHTRLRPASGELEAVKMIKQIAPEGTQIHFCHISSADTMAEIVSHQIGTIEVTPHHLFLACEDFESEETYAKVNPPIRSESERRRLMSSWDKIDVIGSDHAPHTQKEKQEPFDHAPSGIPGVQTMIPLLMAEVLKGTWSLESVIQKTSRAPSSILNIPPAGYQKGMRADFSVYPQETEVIVAENLYSKAGWTPFEGKTAVFPEIVVLGGRVSYELGEFNKGNPVWLQGRGYYHRA